MKSLLLLVAISGVVHADGLPSIPGPCNDVNACEQACNKKGQTMSCVWGANLALQDPDNGEMIARGLAMLDKACMKGHAESCYYLADLAVNAGDNGDNAKARKYYDLGCTLKHEKSCVELIKLLVATGDDKSKKAAMVSSKKLIGALEPRCDAKQIDACTKLADLYDLMASQYRDRAASLEQLRN